MRFPLLLVMACGYRVSISTIGTRGRVQCTDSCVLVWSNFAAHLSQECQEEVVFSLSVSQNPVSITSAWTECILKLTQTKKDKRINNTCTQKGVHKIWACNHSKKKSACVNLPELFADWQLIRKPVAFTRDSVRQLLCQPPSWCSVGEKRRGCTQNYNRLGGGIPFIMQLIRQLKCKNSSTNRIQPTLREVRRGYGLNLSSRDGKMVSVRI